MRIPPSCMNCESTINLINETHSYIRGKIRVYIYGTLEVLNNYLVSKMAEFRKPSDDSNDHLCVLLIT